MEGGGTPILSPIPPSPKCISVTGQIWGAQCPFCGFRSGDQQPLPSCAIPCHSLCSPSSSALFLRAKPWCVSPSQWLTLGLLQLSVALPLGTVFRPSSIPSELLQEAWGGCPHLPLMAPQLPNSGLCLCMWVGMPALLQNMVVPPAATGWLQLCGSNYVGPRRSRAVRWGDAGVGWHGSSACLFLRIPPKSSVSDLPRCLAPAPLHSAPEKVRGHVFSLLLLVFGDFLPGWRISGGVGGVWGLSFWGTYEEPLVQIV